MTKRSGWVPLNAQLRDIRAKARAQGIAEAELKGLTGSRARGMCADGRLEAVKAGSEWHVREDHLVQVAHLLGVPLQEAETASVSVAA